MSENASVRYLASFLEQNQGEFIVEGKIDLGLLLIILLDYFQGAF